MALSEYDVRKNKAATLKANNISTYAPKYKKLHSISHILENHQARDGMKLLRDIDEILWEPIKEFSTAGRVTLYRSHGKLAFGKLMDETGEMQIMFHKDACKMLKNRFPHKVNAEHIQHDPNEKHLWRHVVKMVVVDDEGNIAVSHAATFDNYSLPGWGVDDGDNYYDAVHREAIEEIGTAVQVMYELPKVHEYLKKRDRHQLVYGYLCKAVWQKGEPSFVESEILDGFSVQWIPLDEMVKHLQHQIANPENRTDRAELDGIFKRDLIILEAAQDILDKTSARHDHEWYGDITEISDDVTIDGEHMSPYKFLEKYIDVGDFIGIKWELFTTHKGEPTLFVSDFQLLSKALRPLGDKFHGIGDDQERAYRQRYLDMIFNRETLERMKFRSNFIRALREFYWSNGFYEIDCPVLTSSASGAAAKPFMTHHNDFDREFYLRICNETELKKATIGGLEKVYTIATNFRNEWSDPSHLQEFMMLEHQSVYASYHEDMIFTEKMFDYVFDTLKLDRIIKVKDKQWIEKDVDFTTPWPKLDYVEGVNNASGLDITSYTIDDADRLRADIKSKGIEFEWMEAMGTMTLIDYLYKKVLRPSIVWPVFLYNYPSIIAPLARISDTDPLKCEKWQVVVNGREVINSYGELVDPVRQRDNFHEQSKASDGWDAEATSADYEYVTAMEYGMPIQAWFGMGIDRMIALLTQQDNLRDVVMFPLMKPENNQTIWGGDTNETEDMAVSSATTTDAPKATAQTPTIERPTPPLPTREDAESLATKYLTETLRHCQQVGQVMAYFARKLGQDEHYWYTVGLLHDIDWDHISKDGAQHLDDAFHTIAAEINLDQTIIDDIRSHYTSKTAVPVDSLVRKYLISIDELTGLIHAYSLMRPTGLEGIERSSLNKRIKDKKFAAGVDREHVKHCEVYLNVPLAEFAMEVVEAMK